MSRRCERSCSAPTRWSSTAGRWRARTAQSGKRAGPAAGAAGRERERSDRRPRAADRGGRPNRRITPAGEWLLDNFYLIEEQIRTARRHLPKAYSRELPRLLERAVGRLAARLRHRAGGRSRTATAGSTRRASAGFVAAYQTVTPLKLGELWAIPIMLRLALIENLRRVGARIAADRIDGISPITGPTEMIEIAEQDPKNLILVVADMARSNPPMSSAFVAEAGAPPAGAERGAGAAADLDRAAAGRVGPDDRAAGAGGKPAAGRRPGSISNSIGSLRFLGAMDWREFVETMSVVEQILREDPGGVYGRMDFATRDRYRHVVEKIAKCSGAARKRGRAQGD